MARRNRTVSVEGFEELNRALDRVGNKATGLLLQRAAEAGAQVIVEEAQRLAPKKSGALARGIRWRLRRAQLGRALMDISYSAKQWYGRIIEKGSKHQPAHPFLRPALDTKKDEAQRKIGDVLRHALRDVMS